MICQKWIDEVGYLSRVSEMYFWKEKKFLGNTVTFMVEDIG